MAGVSPFGVWHVAIPTTDLERSKRFYEEVLGLDVMPTERRRLRPGSGNRFRYEWYEVGSVEFHLMQQNPSLLEDTAGRVNPTVETHVAFQVADIDAAKKTLDDAGIPYIDMTAVRDNPNQARQMFIRDPDGNLIEIAQR